MFNNESLAEDSTKKEIPIAIKLKEAMNLSKCSGRNGDKLPPTMTPSNEAKTSAEAEPINTASGRLLVPLRPIVAI